MAYNSVCQYVSDIHHEFRQGIHRLERTAPTLVLAGDIGNLSTRDSLTEFIDYCSRNWDNVVYVLGNHEYYSKTMPMDDTLKTIRKIVEPYANVHLLERDIVIIDGQRYLGCTLWSAPISSHRLNDFKMIRDHTETLSLEQFQKNHVRDVNWLYDNLQEGDIVVTHFMPFTTTDLVSFGHQSIYPPCRHMDSYYGNTDCWELFKRKPLLWISGHTHQKFKVNVPLTDGTLIPWVCNPVGYPGEH